MSLIATIWIIDVLIRYTRIWIYLLLIVVFLMGFVDSGKKINKVSPDS